MTIFGKKNGMALVWVMIAMTMMLSMIAVGVVIMQRTISILDTDFEYYGQAVSMAKAGLSDSMAWFRRQTTQPVIIFSPQRDLESEPPINETDDPAFGIIREFEIDGPGRIFGRYEVSKTVVENVSAQRGFSTSNSIWYLEATGYVYLRENLDLPFDIFPNRILSYTRFGTEIRRNCIVLPAPAAIATADPNQCIIGSGVTVSGGIKYGIAFPPNGTPKLKNGSIVTGLPTPTAQVIPFLSAPEQIFGMTEAELRSIADYVVTSADDVPNPVPDYKIVFIDGNATFNSSRILNGTGILYCTGNMTIASNSESVWNGIIYCKGNYRQLSPSSVNGTIIGLGLINLENTAGANTVVNFNQGIIDQIQNRSNQYKFNKGMFQLE